MFSNIKLAVLSIFSFAILAQFGIVVALLPTNENQLIPTLKAATAISQDMQRALDSWSTAAQSPVTVSALCSNFAKIDERFLVNFMVLKESDEYTDDDAGPALAALDNFTNTHVKMLQTIIDKRHFFEANRRALGEPFHAALKTHEEVISHYGEAVESVLAIHKAEVLKDIRALLAMTSKVQDAVPY